MLIVILFRCVAGHFKPDHHFGFEAVSWYWHFVDVVWLLLFIFVYWWGSGNAPIAPALTLAEALYDRNRRAIPGGSLLGVPRTMIRLRPALWPTLISLPVLVVSLGLGIWQMERREWKRDILDRMAVNQAAAPVTLDELVRGNPLRREYGRVTLEGRFSARQGVLSRRAQPEEHGRPAGGERRCGAEDGRIVLFDRGWGAARGEGSRQARRGAGRRHRQARRHRAPHPGAAPIRPRQRAGAGNAGSTLTCR